MKTPSALLLGSCPPYNCAVFCSADDPDQIVICPNCGRFVRLHNPTTRFAAAEWEACEDPELLRVAFRWGLDLRMNERKQRLYACGIARAVTDVRNDYGFRLAVETGEALADDQPISVPIELVREPLNPPRVIGGLTHGYEIADRCVREVDDRGIPTFPDEVAPSVLCDLFRDLIPNPFVPLSWNPDWLTPTVRDLTQHIYTTHDFGAMPVLADALQDAGCDSDYILSHCRANKPHARGCWVLDAILGKS